MTVTIDLIDLLLFIILGFLAGTAAAAFVYGRASSRYRVRNTIVGMLGAVLGTFLFRVLDIQPSGTLARGITLAEIIIAFVGAVLLIGLLGGWRR